MRRTVKLYAILLIILLAWADVSCAGGPSRKLGRGIANTFTGWIELFITPYENFEKRGNIAEGLCGIPAGIAKAGLRTIAGIYELISFAFPIPENYDPILTPEFVTVKPFVELDDIDDE